MHPALLVDSQLSRTLLEASVDEINMNIDEKVDTKLGGKHNGKWIHENTNVRRRID